METELVKVDELKAELAPVVQRATDVVIVTPADYELAAQGTKDIKAALKKVDAFFDPGIDSARKTWKLALAQKAVLADPLKHAEGIYKEKQKAWTQEQERKRLAEEARLNAIEQERARKEREKQEAAARMQREKEIRAQREAEEARRKAVATKNAAERERLQRESEAKQKAATAAAAKAEAKEEAAASVQANTVTVASVAPKVKGQSFKKTFKAELVNMDDLIAAATVKGSVASTFLLFNDSVANAFARATRGIVKVGGVEFNEGTSLSSTSK